MGFMIASAAISAGASIIGGAMGAREERKNRAATEREARRDRIQERALQEQKRRYELENRAYKEEGITPYKQFYRGEPIMTQLKPTDPTTVKPIYPDDPMKDKK